MTEKKVREEKLSASEQIKIKTDNLYLIILHNDDKNTFEYVIEKLRQECKHDECQAEQCALITHYKGKCDIMKGELSELKTIKERLQSLGLSVTLELDKK